MKELNLEISNRPQLKQFLPQLDLESPTLIDLLSWRAERQTDKPAYIFMANGNLESGSLTYGELDRKARAIGRYDLKNLFNGVDENGLVSRHPGLNPAGTGGIVDFEFNGDGIAENADFSAPGYQVARIRIQAVDPSPDAPIFGTAGDDIFDAADSGDDFNGNGNILFTGEGNDLVDAFWITTGELITTANTITDFELDGDVIGVAGIGATDLDDLELSQVGNDAVTSFSDFDLATLLNTQTSDLSANGTFVFA